ncbi:MAG: hypothetical protein COB30_000125 [Ectothiorhodospiraceae bacterium]|nr:hypothetical protein [Ectothiorhodospiraceae bacterium]
MKISNQIVAVSTLLVSSVLYANDESNISLITDNIMKVCDKPENAGSYWDINVRADGEADIKLKIADLGVTGEVVFSKSEWEGIQRTVEDNIDYRTCVKELSPLFVKRFAPIIKSEESKKTSTRRVLGGVRWQELGAGLKVTLSSCYRQSSSVICEFIANSMESDSSVELNEGSAIYDQSGNKYVSSQLSIANFKSSFKRSYLENMQGELVKGVDTMIQAKFSNVTEESIMVSKAMLIGKIKQAGARAEAHTYAFRDIKISLK